MRRLAFAMLLALGCAAESGEPTTGDACPALCADGTCARRNADGVPDCSLASDESSSDGSSSGAADESSSSGGPTPRELCDESCGESCVSAAGGQVWRCPCFNDLPCPEGTACSYEPEPGDPTPAGGFCV